MGPVRRVVVDRALTQADALDLLRRPPDLLEEVVMSDGSRLKCGDERITGVDPVRGRVHARPGRQKRGPYGRLLERVPPPRTAPAVR